VVFYLDYILQNILHKIVIKNDGCYKIYAQLFIKTVHFLHHFLNYQFKFWGVKIVLKQHLCKFLFITSLLFFSSLNSVQAEECISNNSSVLVINGKTGKILFADQSDAIIYPASLTKLMTLYLTFEALKHKKLKMNQKLLISSRAQETSEINTILTLNLKAGDKISVSKAVRGLIVKSFNGLSVALAEAVAGDEWQFARNMNVKARELGMKFSNFRNSSGFDNVGQYSTNEDLIKLVLALKKDFPEYEHLFAIKIFNYNG
jgi:D-alanyl-D-alanine carboxypeptidase